MNQNPIIYPGIYKDALGQIEINIENRFDESSVHCLFVEIEGVRFKGSSFDDFQLYEAEKYTSEQLNRFTFNKVNIYQSDDFIFELCNCELEFNIPAVLIDYEKNAPFETALNIHLKLGKPKSNGGIDYEQANFQLSINGKSFSADGDLFETGLEQLHKQFNDQYHFKNCFGCLYSDYSPYGNGFFASLQCFRNLKKEYLAVSNKRQILDLAKIHFISVQETYCCKDFEIRTKNTGYRG